MRRGNLSTLRIFFNWKSSWYTKYFYKALLYKDLILHFYLNSLFLKLRFNTSNLTISYFNNNLNICFFDIYVNSFYRLKRYYQLFFNRICTIYNKLVKYLKISIDYYSKFDLFIHKTLALDFFYVLFKLKFGFLKFKIFLKLSFLPFYTIYYYIVAKYISFFSLEYFTFIKYKNVKKFNRRTIYKIKYYNTIVSFDSKLYSSFNFHCNNHITNSVGLITDRYIKNNIFIPFNNNNFYDKIYKNMQIFNQYILLIFYNNIYILNFFLKKIISLVMKNKFYNAFFLNKTININYIKNLALSYVNSTIKHSHIGFFKANRFKYKLILLLTNLYLNSNKTIIPYSMIKINFLKTFKYVKKSLKYIINRFNTKKQIFIFWFFTKIWLYVFNQLYFKHLQYLNYKTNYIKFMYNYNIKLNQFIHCFNFSYTAHISYAFNFYKYINFIIKLKTTFNFLKLPPKQFKKYFKIIYFNQFIKDLLFLLEKSLYIYNNNIDYYLLPNVFFFYKPFLTSAKLITDYLYFKLKKKLGIMQVYNKIKKWQLLERSLTSTYIWNLVGRLSFFKRYKKNNFLAKFRRQLKINLIFKNSVNIRTPLKGIRCLCSGPPNKGRRKMRNFYHLWVANTNLTGLMPLQQLRYIIDYHQTFIVLKRATIGLKVWILFESYIILK